MYIRTKNHIYKVESETCDKQGYFVGEYDVILKEQVINQSENIEELCDEFVIVINEERPTSLINYDNLSLLKVRVVKDNQKVYGAIWTSKGLIVVAKMNDKGELELI